MRKKVKKIENKNVEKCREIKMYKLSNLGANGERLLVRAKQRTHIYIIYIKRRVNGCRDMRILIIRALVTSSFARSALGPGTTDSILSYQRHSSSFRTLTKA